MAALRRVFLPPARWPFCFVAYGLFWAVVARFWPVFAGWPASASDSKTLAKPSRGRFLLPSEFMDNRASVASVYISSPMQ